MSMKLFQLIYVGGRTSQDQASYSSCNSLPEEPLTEAAISGMSRAAILKCLGIESKQTLDKLRRSLLNSSVTTFVKNLAEDKVIEVVLRLKLPRKSRERTRCRGSLIKHYLEHKDQQAQIRDLLRIRRPVDDDHAQSAEAMNVDVEEVDTDMERVAAGETNSPRSDSDSVIGTGSGGPFRKQPPARKRGVKEKVHSHVSSKKPMTGLRQNAAASKRSTDVNSDNLNHKVSHEELFTAGSIREMSRADVLQVLGYKSKKSLGELQKSLLKTSITSFVEKMLDEKVKAVVAHLKLPRQSQKKGRCRGALIRYYLEHEEQQAHIRATLLAGPPDAENEAEEE